MPSYLNRYRYKPQTEDLLQRRKTTRLIGFSDWQDPHPNVLGTMPEKRVYAELINRKIPFMFQTWLRVQIPQANFDDWYRPDFILPDRKIIIEVQGAYFHTKPEQVEKDAFKYALYTQLGYKVLTWWDYDIISNVYMLFAQEPTLGWIGGQRGGRIITSQQEIIDDAKGIRTANTKRTEYKAPTYGTSYRPKRKAKPLRSYSTSF